MIRNKVEAYLRSWAGQLRNGAYRERVTKAADEIKRLDTLLGAFAWRISKGECTCPDGGQGFQCEVCEAKNILANLEEQRT